MTPRIDAVHWLTLRELDQQALRPKGAAFRAFKQLAPQWKENQDYQLLLASEDSVEIAALKKAGRVYPSSRNVLLLSAQTAQRIAETLR